MKPFWNIAYVVWDAFENVQRAWVQFEAMPKEPHPIGACEIKLPGQKEIYCKTEDEWNALVFKHFGIEKP